MSTPSLSFHTRVTGGFDVTRPGTNGPEALGHVWHHGDGTWRADDGRGSGALLDSASGTRQYESREAAGVALADLADLRASLNRQQDELDAYTPDTDPPPLSRSLTGDLLDGTPAEEPATPPEPEEDEAYDDPPGVDVFERVDNAVRNLGWTNQNDQAAYNNALWDLAKATQDLAREVKTLRAEVTTLRGES